MPHQRKVCEYITEDPNRGILVFHNVGSGKTITSLIAANCLYKKYNKKIIILTPSGLVSNFQKEIKKLNLTIPIDIYSYGVYVNMLKKQIHLCQDSILIIDEAHNFGQLGKRGKYILACAKTAFKIILLTATPVRNNPNEIIPLLSMIQTKNILNLKKKFGMAMTYLELGNAEYFDELFKCKVSFYNLRLTQDYPKTKQHTVELKMTKDYYNAYYLIQEDIRENIPELYASTKNLTTFLNGIRRAVNSVDIVSPKVTWTIKEIKKGKKVLVYSTWKATGTELIKDELTKLGIPYVEVSGEISKEQKAINVKKYNRGDVKVMLITSAGAEGLDLKETRKVIILEPYWNEARLQQIIGRAVRYKSHANLPPKERIVDIYHLILKKPKELIGDDKTPSADQMLQILSEYKTQDINLFYKGLENASIEKNRC